MSKVSKKKVLATITGFVLVFVFVSVYLISNHGSASETQRDNDTIQETESFSPQIFTSLNFLVFENVRDLLKFTDCVVIASFSERPRDVEVYIESEAQRAKLRGEEPPKDYVTKYKLNVSKVIQGEVEGDVITLSLLGLYESNWYAETKLEPNTQYLLFLNRRDYDKEYDESKAKEQNSFFENDKILYQLINAEGSVFEIREDNTLYPQAKIGFAPLFDGKPLEDLLKEIRG